MADVENKSCGGELELRRIRRAVLVVLILSVVTLLGVVYGFIYFRKKVKSVSRHIETARLHAPEDRGAADRGAGAGGTFVAVSTWTPPPWQEGFPPPPEVVELLAERVAAPRRLPVLSILDEVGPYEQGGHLFHENASFYLREKDCARGNQCFEVQLEGDGGGRVVLRPRLLRVGEFDRLHFAYRKSNPSSNLWFGLVAPGGDAAILREGDPSGQPGWIVARRGLEWNEVEVDLRELLAAQGLPEDTDRLLAVFFGLTEAGSGDSAFLDDLRVSRSGAAAPGSTVRLAGHVVGPLEGAVVRLQIGGEAREAVPGGDGAFAFPGLPRGAVVELQAIVRGRRYHSVAGDLFQLDSDRSDADIPTEDLRALQAARVPEVDPAWTTMGGPGLPEFGTQFRPHEAMTYVGPMNQPYEFSPVFVPNRFGVYDRDRRFRDPDERYRILLLGDCSAEGLQSELQERVGPRLETFLRRRYGARVEVLTLGFSNANPAAIWGLYQRLGRHFEPDLVLMDVNAAASIYMEPRIMKRVLGWDPRNAAQANMELDDQGVIHEYPANSDWPVFATKPEGGTLERGILANWVMHIPEEQMPPEGLALSRLFPAVLSLYSSEVALRGGRIAAFSGARAYTYSEPQDFQGTPASHAHYHDNMNRWTALAGMPHLDISDYVLSWPDPKQTLRWKNDGHPTPELHYLLAEGLAQELVERGLVPTGADG